MRLAIAVPALDHVSAYFANDLAKLYAETKSVLPQVTLAMMVGTFVHQAREKLLHDVTELWGATHILWLDADMTFPMDAALRLLKHDKEIVAANYVKRVAPHRPTASKGGHPVSSAGATGLDSVDHVGMGVFLMKTSVLLDLPSSGFCDDEDCTLSHGPNGLDPHFRPRFWYSTMTETEDVYFCRLLRKAGHDIWIDNDLSQEVGHMGQHKYQEKALEWA